MHMERSRPGISTVGAAIVVIVIIIVAAVVVVTAIGLPGRPTNTNSTTSSKTSTQTTGQSTTSTTSTVDTTTSSRSTTSTTSTSTTNTSSGAVGIRVDATFSNGTASPGVFVELANSTGEVATGYTPVTFPAQSGTNYSVIVSDSGGHFFNHWSQDNFTSRVYPIEANGSTVSLTAIFTSSPQPPPSTPYSVSITSQDLNGTSISGYYMDVRVDGYHIESGFTPVNFTNLEPGVQYQIVAYWSGNYYFRNFGGGDLNRYQLITFNATGPTKANFTGLYQYVSPSQAASLNIMAELPNGTILGTTFNNSNYIQHTPGLWLTVTPPGTTSPFTGTFTGGSILPFILFSGDTYTVQMTLAYGNLKFAYWKDTGSTAATRSVFLNTNTTLIAVYEES